MTADIMRLRRTLLYVPGNMPGMLQNIPIFHCDGVMIDLEDAVPDTEKDGARTLVRSFLDSHPNRNKEIIVRINPLDGPLARRDLEEILPARPDVVRLPKADTPELVERLDTMLTEFEEDLNLPIGTFRILPSIESALGVLNCVRTALISERIVALAFGAEDFTATMGIERTKGGDELFAARTRIAWAAKAAGVEAIDTIFADTSDMEGLRAEARIARGLGFTGKSLVNPRQIDVVHEVFAPKDHEIENAKAVVEAIKRARALGTGVISLDGRMVDAPVVKRARRVLSLALAHGLVELEPEEETILAQE